MRLPLTHVPRLEARAAIAALVVAVTLAAGKFTAYFVTGSAAIFSDAMESIVNVAAAAYALYSLSIAHTPADRDHPYGHGKIEFFSAGFEGGMIVLAAVVAVAKGVHDLVHPELEPEHLLVGILVLCAALAVNGTVGRFLIRVGRRANSLTLEADGRHLMTDAVTSVVALVALLLVLWSGRRWIDPVAAIVVALYIATIGVGLVRQAAAGLMDRQDKRDQLLLQRILDSHLGPDGKEPRICSYHKLRHRHSGRYHWVDFHIMVPADWDIDRGHRVASNIEYEIEQALGEGNATAHVEPCVEHGCRSCAAMGGAATSQTHSSA